MTDLSICSWASQVTTRVSWPFWCTNVDRATFCSLGPMYVDLSPHRAAASEQLWMGVQTRSMQPIVCSSAMDSLQYMTVHRKEVKHQLVHSVVSSWAPLSLWRQIWQLGS